VRDSIDILGCERIDHGYHVVDDPALVARCRAAGTFFTACPTTTTYTTMWRDLSSPAHAIRRMLDAGLALTINSDDPGLMRTTLLDEYRIAIDRLGATTAQVKELCLNGLRASWLDTDEKRKREAAWEAEIDEILAAAVRASFGGGRGDPGTHAGERVSGRTAREPASGRTIGITP
jgi:adenosine deaminase